MCYEIQDFIIRLILKKILVYQLWSCTVPIPWDLERKCFYNQYITLSVFKLLRDYCTWPLHCRASSVTKPRQQHSWTAWTPTTVTGVRRYVRHVRGCVHLPGETHCSRRPHCATMDRSTAPHEPLSWRTGCRGAPTLRGIIQQQHSSPRRIERRGCTEKEELKAQCRSERLVEVSGCMN